MLPVTIEYKEASMLLPQSENRQVTHRQVYDALSSSRGKRTERDYVFSVSTGKALGKLVMATIRAPSLPDAIPSVESAKTFTVGDTITARVELVTMAQIPGKRYQYRERRADEIKGWIDEMMARHGFSVNKATWGQATRHRIASPKAKAFAVPSMLFEVELTVVEASRCAAAWLNGIGRKKGYGFGMLEAIDESL